MAGREVLSCGLNTVQQSSQQSSFSIDISINWFGRKTAKKNSSSAKVDLQAGCRISECPVQARISVEKNSLGDAQKAANQELEGILNQYCLARIRRRQAKP